MHAGNLTELGLDPSSPVQRRSDERHGEVENLPDVGDGLDLRVAMAEIDAFGDRTNLLHRLDRRLELLTDGGDCRRVGLAADAGRLQPLAQTVEAKEGDIEIHGQRREGIPHLMGESCGHHPEGVGALGLEHPPLELLQLATRLVDVEGFPQSGLELGRLPRLAEVAPDLAPVDGIDGVREIRERGDQDAHGVGISVGRDLEQLDAGHAGHALVGEQYSDLASCEDLEGLAAAGRGLDAEVVAARRLQHHQIRGVVVDVQDRVVESDLCAQRPRHRHEGRRTSRK